MSGFSTNGLFPQGQIPPSPAGTATSPPAPPPNNPPASPTPNIEASSGQTQPVMPPAQPAQPPTPPAPPAAPANIEAGAGNQHAPTPPAAPAVATTVADMHAALVKMYERDAISADIMAQAMDQGWTPYQALQAQTQVNNLKFGPDGKPNVPGYPNMPTHDRKEPNGDMIMAAAFLMEQCGFRPQDFDAKSNKDAVLKLDERTIDAATSGDYRGIRFSDLCAHAANSFYDSRMNTRRRLNSMRPMEYFEACVRAQEEIDKKLVFADSDDIRADADTGLSTIGLKNIWALINTATIGKAYQEVPTVWQRICKQTSVSNFLKHTVHRTQMVGEYQRLSRVGGEPPHATYQEDMTEAKIDSWGLMLTLSFQDIVNDEVGVFRDAAADLGRLAAVTLEKECFAALLSDGAQLFTTGHKNYLLGTDSAFGFDALDKAFTLFRKQTGMNGEPIMVRPSFLLLPSTLLINATRLLSMGTVDGSPLGQVTGYQNFPIVEAPYLVEANGLYTVEGSKRTAIPGNDAGWYLFADPNTLPVIVATFLNGRSRPTIQRANMRFSLDGIQYKSTMHFEFNTSEYRGGVYSKGKQ